ncbi:MAG TPA: GGDEF domain-containing protein [Thermoanaerobaculia bacterium]|nr:GGDEF domain-containing protein [Thermoanaerobaculia bacterium]
MRRLLRIALCCLVAGSLAAQSPPPDGVKALLAQGDALEQAGRLDEAARVYVTARVEAERAGDRKSAAQACAALGYLRYYRGEMNQALVDLRRAYDIYGTINDVQGQRSALEIIAHVYADAQVAQYDRAIEYYRQLLSQYEAAGEAENVADTLYNIGGTYAQKSDYQTALEWYGRALAAEKKLGRRGEVAAVERTMGVALGNLGRFMEALPLFDDALRVFAESNDAEAVMQVRQSRGIVLRKLGRMDAAIADLEATRDWYAKNRNTRFLEKSQDELALAYASTGRWHDAYRTRTAHEALERELAVQLREEHTSHLRVQFDSEKKEQENRALLRENAAASRIRRLQTIILLLGALAIGALVYLAFRLRRMALTDELTRLPNRRRILAVADHELQRARTSGEAFSLLAIDIDEFKSINDRLGHAAGDLVLQRVAHTCRTTLGPTDRIGRTGGEEFLAILPRTPLAVAHTLAERLRAAVERLDLTDIDPTLHVTISMGLTGLTTADDALARIARRADELLYRAKQAGRNRVEVAA